MIVGFLIDRHSVMYFAVFLMAVALEASIYYVTFLFQQKFDDLRIYSTTILTSLYAFIGAHHGFTQRASYTHSPRNFSW